MDDPKTVQIDGHKTILSIAFDEDDKRILTGGHEGVIREWSVDGGMEVGDGIEASTVVLAIVPSKDRKWMVTQDSRRVNVWDRMTRKKFISVEHGDLVHTVDVSPDSSKFATGSQDKTASIWDIKTGERLVGPLEHDGDVVVVRFSPDGGRLATATYAHESLRIYDTHTGDKLLEFPVKARPSPSTPLVWSSDGQKIFAACWDIINCIHAWTGSVLSEWKTHSNSYTSIALANSEKFIICAAGRSISLWDTSTLTQIGSRIDHDSQVHSIALSHDDRYLATGEESGNITITNLWSILPLRYHSVNVSAAQRSQLPFVDIGDTLEPKSQEDGLSPAKAFSNDDISYDDAIKYKQSLSPSQYKQSLSPSIPYIAKALTLIGKNNLDDAMRVFDLVFANCDPNDNKYLLLIKSILLFTAGKCEDGLSRVQDLIETGYDNDLCSLIQAKMHILNGDVFNKGGGFERALKSFQRARELLPSTPELDSRTHLISLIFGWSFTGSKFLVQRGLCEAMYGLGRIEAAAGEFLKMLNSYYDEDSKDRVLLDWITEFKARCIDRLDSSGDSVVDSGDYGTAIVQYSAVLSLDPVTAVRLRVLRKLCNVRLGEGLWDAALHDADELIKLEPSNYTGYELKHAALYGAQRYDDAVSIYCIMLFVMKSSPDNGTRQLLKKYVTPEQIMTAIDTCIRNIFQLCPLVLIDVTTSRLCDGPERIRIFKSEKEYKQLVSLITTELDLSRIQRTVATYFQYITFSHVWEGKEPTLQDINSIESIWKLPSTQQNVKVQNFCETVRQNGGRWCWSDTCCIDKTDPSVQSRSITSMYRWYELAAETLVYLADVTSPSEPGNLANSRWMTRAWTGQELLSSKVIRFYTRDWKLYLTDKSANHKESPVILAELSAASGIPPGTMTSFSRRDLGVMEKLRFASMRKATVDEDLAYSLIGIFESDIVPRYGEGKEVALGHLLEEIVSRTGEIAVLAWTGTSSVYNSALPSDLSVYSQTPCSTPTLDDRVMEAEIARLLVAFPHSECMTIYDRVTRLPAVRFANRHLYLPCITFPVKALQSLERNVYRASASVIGTVDITTTALLPIQDPRKLVLVHPWIHHVLDQTYQFDVASSHQVQERRRGMFSRRRLPWSAIGTGSGRSTSGPVPVDDKHVLALRMIARLRQPFTALLLEERSPREFVRVATEREIVVKIAGIRSSGDIRTAVLDVV